MDLASSLIRSNNTHELFYGEIFYWHLKLGLETDPDSAKCCFWMSTNRIPHNGQWYQLTKFNARLGSKDRCIFPENAQYLPCLVILLPDEYALCQGGLKLAFRIRICLALLDPEPHLFGSPVSGSAFIQLSWIRILIYLAFLDPDPHLLGSHDPDPHLFGSPGSGSAFVSFSWIRI